MSSVLKLCIYLALCCVFIVQAQGLLPQIKTFTERVTEYGYPVEEHQTQTDDGYILTLHRIPSSPNLQTTLSNKPVVLLLHSLLGSSQSWVIGEHNALAYGLADAGYDVWLGNNRGSTYSSTHISKPPQSSAYWKYSWNEMGKYDLPAMIDFVLATTGQSALHYVGYSQSTTIFVTMLSHFPIYNSKINTAHLMAPVSTMENAKSPMVRLYVDPFYSDPNPMLLGSREFLSNSQLINLLGKEVCELELANSIICSNIMFLIFGWDSQHLNKSLVAPFVETHPDHASIMQFWHFGQNRKSGKFREFDYGAVMNQVTYGTSTPPKYKWQNVHPNGKIHLFYSDNDLISDPIDVMNFASNLGSHVEMHHVAYASWNHLDFFLGNEVKSEINDKIQAYIADYELNN